MQYRRVNSKVIWPRRKVFHVLTYAEEGFSPLNMHTKELHVPKESLMEFANRVNTSHSLQTLFPTAPLTAIPRSLVRQSQDIFELASSIEAFLEMNAETFHASKVLIDLRTPNIHPNVYGALDTLLHKDVCHSLDELVVIDDQA